MARRKTTLTAKQKTARGNRLAQAAKNAIPKNRQTTVTGKAPCKQLVAKAVRKQGEDSESRQNHATTMLFWHYMKSGVSRKV